MSKTNHVTTKEALENVPLPDNGPKYTVVSHPFIVKKTLDALAASGFTVKEEIYASCTGGKIGQGIYYLNHGSDTELGLMFAWANSYNKVLRFRCAVGAYVKGTGNGMIEGDMSNYGRLHVTNADEDVEEHIKQQIANANTYYDQLVKDKNIMKGITLSPEQIGSLMGVLYFNQVITSTQMIRAVEECKKSTTEYGVPNDNLWAVYNHITNALKKARPDKWMESQKKMHRYIKTNLFTKPEAPAGGDPNQVDLEEMIEEVDMEAIDAQIRKPAMDKLFYDTGKIMEFGYNIDNDSANYYSTDEEKPFDPFSVSLAGIFPDGVPQVVLDMAPDADAFDNIAKEVNQNEVAETVTEVTEGVVEESGVEIVAVDVEEKHAAMEAEKKTAEIEEAGGTVIETGENGEPLMSAKTEVLDMSDPTTSVIDKMKPYSDAVNGEAVILGADSPEEEAEVKEALVEAGIDTLPGVDLGATVDASDLVGEYSPEEVPALVKELEERRDAVLTNAAISIKDVQRVATSIDVTLTGEEIAEVMDNYSSDQANDPTATWELVVENSIHNLISHREVATPLSEQVAHEEVQPITDNDIVETIAEETGPEAVPVEHATPSAEPSPQLDDITQSEEEEVTSLGEESNDGTLELPDFDF